jgi:hypothetical protein
MHEMKVSVWAAAATTLWAIGGVLLLVAWVLTFTGHHEIAMMLAVTAVVIAAAGATLTVRCYALRTHALIRSLHRLDGLDGGSEDRHGMRSL